MLLSCPSYVIQETWWKNIRYIDRNLPDISNVELLFFIFDEETCRLFEPEEEAIRTYRGRLTYTVHLPDPLLPEHEALVKKTSERTLHWIIHPPETGTETQYRAMIHAWREKYGNRFLLENLIGRNHPWFIKNTDWPLCLDTGHALLRGDSPLEYLSRYRGRIEEIHLHDCREETDHRTLSRKSLWLQTFIPALRTFRGVVNIELFREQEIVDSLQVIRQIQEPHTP